MTTYDRDYHSGIEEFEKRLANTCVYPVIQTLVKVWGEGGEYTGVLRRLVGS